MSTVARPAFTGTGDSGLAGRLSRLSPGYKATIFAGEVLAFLALWQLVVGQWGLVNPVFFPPPLSVLDGLGELVLGGVVAEHALVSVQSWLTGFALAAAIGIPVGLLMGSSLPADRVLGPVAWTIYATPVLAYQPLSKAWFGFGTGPVIFLVVMSAIFPILLNVSAGIRTTQRSLIDACQVYGGTRSQLYRKVYLPSTVAFLFAGLRQGAVMATIGMIAAELTGSSTGMGALIMRTSNTYDTAQSFAAIGLVVAWSVGMTQLIGAVGRRVAPWARTGEA